MEQYKEFLDKGSRKGGVDAIFYEVPYIKVFLKEYGSNYAMIETRHRTDGFGFAFPKGSTLTSHFSRAILNVRESPEMDEIEHKYFGSSNNDEGQSPSNSSLDDASSSSLTTYSFAGLFMLIGVFSLSALIVSESRIWQKPIIAAKMYIQRFLSRRFTRTNPLEEGSTTRRNNVDREENISEDRADDQGKLSIASLTCGDTQTLPV
ncbi:glutamate receptor 2.5-like [Neltuma alba]|uniref:glutamate receptor 2.5-like n=1 Tax=Neltuma alba TaxID=207710 RepID=UPI0010A47DE1|nr:glutamate receptor 2.5-like [Prosopis alba]